MATETEMKFRMSDRTTNALASVLTTAKRVDINQNYLNKSTKEVRDLIFDKFNGLSVAVIAEVRVRDKVSQVVLNKGAMNQRIINTHACTLTCKGSGTLSREEYEVEISPSEFEYLKQFSTGAVYKTRYTFNYKYQNLEYDVYAGVLFGLRTLECEFDPGQYSIIDITEKVLELDPNAVDKTEDKTYKNSYLSVCGGVQFLR